MSFAVTVVALVLSIISLALSLYCAKRIIEIGTIITVAFGMDKGLSVKVGEEVAPKSGLVKRRVGDIFSFISDEGIAKEIESKRKEEAERTTFSPFGGTRTENVTNLSIREPKV